MDSGHNSASTPRGNIVISSSSYVLHEYCTNTDDEGNCIERIQVVPYESMQNQYQAQSEGNSNVLAFAGVIVLFIRLIKGLFRLILPSRGKK